MDPHVSDLDIFRTANRWLELYGDEAVVAARKMSGEFREKGDHEGADTWLRIVIAMGTLRQEQTAVVS